MNEPKPLPSETKKLVEAKFKIGDQWYYRGNRSPMWLFCASRLDGSMCGIAETVPHDWYPLLEALASLADELRLAQTELKGCYRLIDELKEELRLAREEQIALLRFVEHPVTPEMWKALFPKEPR